MSKWAKEKKTKKRCIPRCVTAEQVNKPSRRRARAVTRRRCARAATSRCCARALRASRPSPASPCTVNIFFCVYRCTLSIVAPSVTCSPLVLFFHFEKAFSKLESEVPQIVALASVVMALVVMAIGCVTGCMARAISVRITKPVNQLAEVVHALNRMDFSQQVCRGKCYCAPTIAGSKR